MDKYLNKIIQGDCLEIMKEMPDKCVDLVVTDPPYNIGKDFANDDLDMDEYISWCEAWITECNRVLKFGGALWMTLGWQTIAEVKVIFNEQDNLRLKNWIIWYRQDGWKGDKGFAQSHEHILFYIKDLKTHPETKLFSEEVFKNRTTKNLSALDARKLLGMKVYKNCGNAGKLWFETGRLPDRKQYDGLIKHLEISDWFGNFIDWRFNKTDNGDDVWTDIKSEKDRKGHPTQKPVDLMARIVTVSSDEGDTILDPFLGSGTTAVACKQLKRNYIGIELSEKYCEIANRRLEQDQLF